MAAVLWRNEITHIEDAEERLDSSSQKNFNGHHPVITVTTLIVLGRSCS